MSREVLNHSRGRCVAGGFFVDGMWDGECRRRNVLGEERVETGDSINWVSGDKRSLSGDKQSASGDNVDVSGDKWDASGDKLRRTGDNGKVSD